MTEAKTIIEGYKPLLVAAAEFEALKALCKALAGVPRIEMSEYATSMLFVCLPHKRFNEAVMKNIMERRHVQASEFLAKLKSQE